MVRCAKSLAGDTIFGDTLAAWLGMAARASKSLYLCVLGRASSC